MSNEELTLHEQTILLSIWRLQDNAYGVTLRENVMKVTKKNIHYGTLYNTLNKLVKKGYVETESGEPTHERGGRRKIYYSLTERGKTALQKARSLQSALWKGIPDFDIGVG
ncbi:PadR family transcriptional regulator [candidate division KSB1 bacterium]